MVNTTYIYIYMKDIRIRAGEVSDRIQMWENIFPVGLQWQFSFAHFHENCAMIPRKYPIARRNFVLQNCKQYCKKNCMCNIKILYVHIIHILIKLCLIQVKTIKNVPYNSVQWSCTLRHMLKSSIQLNEHQKIK